MQDFSVKGSQTVGRSVSGDKGLSAAKNWIRGTFSKICIKKIKTLKNQQEQFWINSSCSGNSLFLGGNL